MILSGGVSKGKADFLPEVLRELGVEQLFHEVQQRPGKPFWFGQYMGGAVVFALPGNPVSTFVNFQRYARPWLLAVQQPTGTASTEAGPVSAVLVTEVTFRPKLTHFLLVRLEYAANGQLLAHPERAGGSGDWQACLPVTPFWNLLPSTSYLRPARCCLPGGFGEVSVLFPTHFILEIQPHIESSGTVAFRVLISRDAAW